MATDFPLPASPFVAKNSHGFTVNLLNEDAEVAAALLLLSMSQSVSCSSSSSLIATPLTPSTPTSHSGHVTPLPIDPKRRHVCLHPNCGKAFTTSGHLARHNRIHTGEKNFKCIMPGCESMFSRQDNMMQHYRTHLSSNSRKSRKSTNKKSSSHSPY